MVPNMRRNAIKAISILGAFLIFFLNIYTLNFGAAIIIVPLLLGITVYIYRLSTDKYDFVHQSKRLYASALRRIFAAIFDFIILLIISVIAYIIQNNRKISLIIYAILLGIIIFIPIVAMVALFGQSPGKMILRIKIFKNNGENPSLKNALLRSSVDIIFGIIFTLEAVITIIKISQEEFYFLSFFEKIELINHHSIFPKYTADLMILWNLSELVTMVFNRQKKSLHDLIAGTVVLENRKLIKENI